MKKTALTLFIFFLLSCAMTLKTGKLELHNKQIEDFDNSKFNYENQEETGDAGVLIDVDNSNIFYEKINRILPYQWYYPGKSIEPFEYQISIPTNLARLKIDLTASGVMNYAFPNDNRGMLLELYFDNKAIGYFYKSNYNLKFGLWEYYDVQIAATIFNVQAGVHKIDIRYKANHNYGITFYVDQYTVSTLVLEGEPINKVDEKNFLVPKPKQEDFPKIRKTNFYVAIDEHFQYFSVNGKSFSNSILNFFLPDNSYTSWSLAKGFPIYITDGDTLYINGKYYHANSGVRGTVGYYNRSGFYEVFSTSADLKKWKCNGYNTIDNVTNLTNMKYYPIDHNSEAIHMNKNMTNGTFGCIATLPKTVTSSVIYTQAYPRLKYIEVTTGEETKKYSYTTKNTFDYLIKLNKGEENNGNTLDKDLKSGSIVKIYAEGNTEAELKRISVLINYIDKNGDIQEILPDHPKWKCKNKADNIKYERVPSSYRSPMTGIIVALRHDIKNFITGKNYNDSKGMSCEIVLP